MAKKIETYSQCRFVKEDTGASRVETTGYIDARAAKVGARMTLKGVPGTWRITHAGAPSSRPHHGWGGMD
jgi:hypothetical protein